MSCKVVVVGDVNGQLQTVFSKLASLHAKNHFSFAIIAGNLFSEDPASIVNLIAGNVLIPLCTYFTVGDIPLPQPIIDKIKENEEIVPNLHFLGKRSITKTSEGVRIVNLSGKLDDSITNGASNEQYIPFHTRADAKALYGANTADILLTTLWPAFIRNGSKIKLADNLTCPVGFEHISALCSKIKPRYHFSVTPNLFFEREPFFQTQNIEPLDFVPVTRFISLSAHGIPKQKSFYAFNLPLIVDTGAKPPLGTTASPWSPEINTKKRQAIDAEQSLDDERFGRNGKRNARKNIRKGSKWLPPGPEECFFCLSNPRLETHLITSIGEEAYLTIAKGPLTTAVINGQYDIDFPAHLLIIPLSHSPTIMSITEENRIREKTLREMNQYREALQNMISKGSRNKLGAVTYEISRSNGIHTHWQFIPVPEKFLSRGLAEAALRVEAENMSYPAFEERDPLLHYSEENFFRVWIWTPPSEINARGHTQCLIMPFDEDQRFSLQYGRIVLAKLMGLEDRIQWRDCVQSEKEEMRDNEKVKAAFKEFDFTH